MAKEKQLNLEIIRDRRLLLGYSLQEMAECLYLKDPSTYYRYETGEYKLKAEMLPALSKKLAIKIEDMYV